MGDFFVGYELDEYNAGTLFNHAKNFFKMYNGLVRPKNIYSLVALPLYRVDLSVALAFRDELTSILPPVKLRHVVVGLSMLDPDLLSRRVCKLVGADKKFNTIKMLAFSGDNDRLIEEASKIRSLSVSSGVFEVLEEGGIVQKNNIPKKDIPTQQQAQPPKQESKQDSWWDTMPQELVKKGYTKDSLYMSANSNNHVEYNDNDDDDVDSNVVTNIVGEYRNSIAISDIFQFNKGASIDVTSAIKEFNSNFRPMSIVIRGPIVFRVVRPSSNSLAIIPI